jgi:ArsR family metal-binding transcriptional regulator
MKTVYLIDKKEQYFQIENLNPKLNYNESDSKLNIYDKEKIITLDSDNEISSK